MAGILEWANDPANMGLLNLSAGLLQASGPSRTPIGVGQALGMGVQQGMQGFQQAQQNQMQQQMFGARMDAARRQQEMEASRAAAMARLAQDPRFAGMGDLLAVNPQAAIDRAIPKDRQPVVVAPGAALVDPSNPNAPLFSNPAKPASPSDLARLQAERDALPADDPRRVEYDAAIKKATTSQPLVTVQPDNLGLKPKDRFDMEDKLRGDFRANPTVKAADEMNSAYRLIETASKNPSPANDMAMATKYMKILDPGSVVRESELAMAMNTSGLMDKVQNYAKMIYTGEKLTPTQRADFLSSAKEINDAFQVEKDGIASRFAENAKQYNLSPENVVGSPSKPKDVLSSMPPAKQHKGRVIEDSKGKRYKSDGMTWRPL
jgi:hypothetical protein